MLSEWEMPYLGKEGSNTAMEEQGAGAPDSCILFGKETQGGHLPNHL